jgi:hypothetical protein
VESHGRNDWCLVLPELGSKLSSENAFEANIKNGALAKPQRINGIKKYDLTNPGRSYFR